MIRINLTILPLLVLFVNCKENKVFRQPVEIEGKGHRVKDSTEINQNSLQINKDINKKIYWDAAKSDLNRVNQHKSSKIEYRRLTDLKIFKDFEIISTSTINSVERNRCLTYLKNSDIHVLALEEIVNSISKEAAYILLDTVYYLSNSEEALTDLIECEKIDDADAKQIFAFSEYEDKEYFDKTLKAWKVDLKNNKFNLIDPKKVRCVNIAFDYEE